MYEERRNAVFNRIMKRLEGSTSLSNRQYSFTVQDRHGSISVFKIDTISIFLNLKYWRYRYIGDIFLFLVFVPSVYCPSIFETLSQQKLLSVDLNIWFGVYFSCFL